MAKKVPSLSLSLQIMVSKLSLGCVNLPPCQGGYFTPRMINLFGHLCSSWGTSSLLHYLRPLFPVTKIGATREGVDKSAFFLQKLVDFLTRWTILNSILSSFKLNLRRRARSVPPIMEFWSHAWSHWNKIFRQWSKWNNIRYSVLCVLALNLIIHFGWKRSENNPPSPPVALPVMCVNIPLISIDFAKKHHEEVMCWILHIG